MSWECDICKKKFDSNSPIYVNPINGRWVCRICAYNLNKRKNRYNERCKRE